MGANGYMTHSHICNPRDRRPSARFSRACFQEKIDALSACLADELL